jgi:hypothetical protein
LLYRWIPGGCAIVMSLESESLRDPDAAPRQYAVIRETKVE